MRTGDHIGLTVRGTCMEPDLKDGETVSVRRPRWYFPGDVVAYYSPFEDRYLVHRFLGYVRAGGVWKCLVMADRAAKPDVLIESSRVLGKLAGGLARNGVRPGARRAQAVWRYVYWVSRIALHRGREAAVRAAPYRG